MSAGDLGCDKEPGLQPLVRLFGRAEQAFALEFDRRIRESEFCALSLAHSRNVLRHLGDGPLRASQLVERGDVSKQAVSQQVAYLETNGYVTTGPDPADARARVVRLTAKGARAQCLVQRLFVEIEEDWSTELGVRNVAAVRRLLTRLLEAYPSRGGC